MKFNINDYKADKGMVAIVTGANNGIGFETTIGLARAGYKVIMACRNLQKAEDARLEITLRVEHADLDVLQLDLSDLESVKKFAKEFKKRLLYPTVYEF